MKNLITTTQRRALVAVAAVLALFTGGVIAMSAEASTSRPLTTSQMQAVRAEVTKQVAAAKASILVAAKAQAVAAAKAEIAKATGTGAVRIVHRTVTVNADYQALPPASRKVTFSGLPAYVSSGAAEVWGSNAAGVPDSLTATISVNRDPVSNGVTTRTFSVDPAGFAGAESYTLDVWVLVTQ